MDLPMSAGSLRLAPWIGIVLMLSSLPAVMGCDPPRPSFDPSPPAHKPASKVYAPRERNKVLVLGLDGASWNVITPMIERGLLPHLSSLVESGTSGVLGISEGGTFSPVVWTTMFTGVRPGRHGITGIETSDSTFRHRKTVWNLLTDAGRRSVVLNVPGTFPPEPIDGIEIAGFPMKHAFIGDGSGTHIEADLAGSEGGRDARSFEIRDQTTGERHRFALEIFERAQKGSYSFVLSYEGQLQMGTLAAGRRSELLRYELSPGRSVVTQLVLVDDDGQGRLALHLAPVRRLPHDGWTYLSPASLAEQQPRIVERYFPHEIMWAEYQDPIGLEILHGYLEEAERGRVDVGVELHRAQDWSLFIHVITLPDRVQHPYWPYMRPDDYDLPEGGYAERFGDRVEAAYVACDAWVGRYLEQVDDDTTVFVVSDHGFRSQGWKARAWKRAKGLLASLRGQGPDGPALDRFEGLHQTEGIYIVSGPAIGAGRRSHASGVRNIAPTILYLLGQPIPEDLDGGIMTDLFEVEYLERYGVSMLPGERAVRDDAAPEQLDDSVMEQLRGLGYVE